MRIKKGFTLAEILIVLMVIGVIATMTIPGLMAGVQEAQFKTAYKKAYNIIVNLCAIGRVSGELPALRKQYPEFMLFLGRNLSVKGFVNAAIGTGSAVPLTSTTFKQAMKATVAQETEYAGSSAQAGTALQLSTTAGTYTWMQTEDGFAYTAVKVSGSESTPCGTTLDINAQTKIANAIGQSCFVVVVDVNGLQKIPNILEPQIGNASVETASYKLQALSGDQYYIFVGRDGATSGNTKFTLAGRLVGDVK